VSKPSFPHLSSPSCHEDCLHSPARILSSKYPFSSERHKNLLSTPLPTKLESTKWKQCMVAEQPLDSQKKIYYFYAWLTNEETIDILPHLEPTRTWDQIQPIKRRCNRLKHHRLPNLDINEVHSISVAKFNLVIWRTSLQRRIAIDIIIDVARATQRYDASSMEHPFSEVGTKASSTKNLHLLRAGSMSRNETRHISLRPFRVLDGFEIVNCDIWILMLRLALGSVESSFVASWLNF